MKRLVSVVSVILLVCFVVTAFAACNPNSVKADELVIYNWADYIFDEDLKDFKAYYEAITGRQIEITYVTFDTNETMLTRLTQGDSNVDVVCPSEYAIQKLIEANMLVPLNYFNKAAYRNGLSMNDEQFELFFNGGDSDENGNITDTGNIEAGIVEKVNETFGSLTITETGETVRMVDYFVPYMYGTLGILYNKRAFKELGIYDVEHPEIMNNANWGILFNDDGSGNLLHEALTGNILMKDSIRDSYAATVFYLSQRGLLDKYTDENGNPLYANMSADMLINAVDDTLLDLVRTTLIKQKQQLFGYEVDFGKDDLLMGNAIVDLAWSGDAMYAVEESWDDNLINDDGEKGDYELAYYVPHGAGNIWFDGWVVPKTYNPEHMEQIKIFINYLNRPKSAALNYLEIGYTPAISPDVLMEDGEAMAILMRGYDYDPENSDDCEEFIEQFFGYVDPIDGSNWRYPFESAAKSDPTSPYKRDLSTLGVMKDFGSKNKDVVTAWNSARSSGSGKDALALLGWTALVVAVALGALFAVIGIKRYRSHTVKLPTSVAESEDNQPAA